jgi:hypothetical protein
LRRGLDARLALPPEFYDDPGIQAICAGYDFGALFVRVRQAAQWTQTQLDEVIGLGQARISAIERGVHRLRDIALVAQATRPLGVPPVLLGFAQVVTVNVQAVTVGRKEPWMQRRNFVGQVAGLTLGLAAGLDPERLFALLPHAEPTGTRRLGLADVEVIEQLTAAFMRQDFAYGSGLLRQAATEQVRTVLPLLTSVQVPPELRPRLMLATGRLAMQAGWMNFSANHHEAARRLWLIGLDLARHSDHSLGPDLTMFLLQDMALQAVALNRPEEALGLIRIAETAAIGRHPVAASTTCTLAITQARAHAAAGEAAACDRALGHAEEHFTRINPATAPPWGVYFDEIHFAASQGDVYYALAWHSLDARAAGRAVPLLRQAVDHLGPDYARPQASCLPALAGSYALGGDVGTAVRVGHQAIDAIIALSSPGSYDRLRVLNTVLEPMHASPGVGELRERLSTVAA